MPQKRGVVSDAFDVVETNETAAGQLHGEPIGGNTVVPSIQQLVQVV